MQAVPRRSRHHSTAAITRRPSCDFQASGISLVRTLFQSGDLLPQLLDCVLPLDQPIAFRHGPVALALNKDAKHPVLRNFDKLDLIDETYWKLVGKLPKDRVLGTAVEDGQVQPQLWSLEHGQGRVFVSIPGHYSWTFDDPLFRIILLRAIAWSAREPVDRFNELVWPGADVAR